MDWTSYACLLNQGEGNPRCNTSPFAGVKRGINCKRHSLFRLGGWSLRKPHRALRHFISSAGELFPGQTIALSGTRDRADKSGTSQDSWRQCARAAALLIMLILPAGFWQLWSDTILCAAIRVWSIIGWITGWVTCYAMSVFRIIIWQTLCYIKHQCLQYSFHLLFLA